MPDPLVEEAANEIERLRAQIDHMAIRIKSDAFCLQNGKAISTLHAAETDMSEEVKCPYVVGKTTLHCSLTPFTLTAEEREAIQTAMHSFGESNDDQECEKIEALLWGLLERTK